MEDYWQFQKIMMVLYFGFYFPFYLFSRKLNELVDFLQNTICKLSGEKIPNLDLSSLEPSPKTFHKFDVDIAQCCFKALPQLAEDLNFCRAVNDPEVQLLEKIYSSLSALLLN